MMKRKTGAMMKTMRIKWTAIPLALLAIACQETYSPKPEAYFRIDFPEKSYQRFDSAHYPYSFDYPEYAQARQEHSGPNKPYWANIEFPRYGATIHLTYHALDSNLHEHTELTREFAFKHTTKAEAIGQKELYNPERGIYGILYDIKGNTASSVQFFVTDSHNHYLRGALYFMCKPNKDSLAPAIEFFREDIVRLMESIEWK
jgi:gliding motility-associated lipoprotein GldD